jgi:hypothetical protein
MNMNISATVAETVTALMMNRMNVVAAESVIANNAFCLWVFEGSEIA